MAWEKISCPYICMKKILILMLVLVSCGKEKKETTWEIENINGKRDTIVAKDYWIMSRDSQFIKFEINDTTKIIYNRRGVKCFRRVF